MKIQYEILFEVAVRNEYYKEKESADFKISPTLECEDLLNRYNLIFRNSDYGFKIFAQVVPGTIPPQLFTPFDGKSLKFTFEMISCNSYVDGISKLPKFNPSTELLYFSNLREDVDGGINYLGDQVSNLRVGNPIKMVNTNNLNYKFDSPVNSAVFSLSDMFNNPYSLPNSEFSFSDPLDKVDSFQHDLSKVQGFKSGRYTISDNMAGELPFYYYRSLSRKKIFGIIEVFSDTNDFITPSTNEVPLSYQFVDNDEITGKGSYHIGFASSEYKWMYVCRKNPENASNGLDVNKLTIVGPVAFSKVGGDDITERIILSNDPITSSEENTNVSLMHDLNKIRDLPNPSMGTILKKNNGDKYFEIYIYV